MSKFLIPVSWDSNLRLSFDDLTILLIAVRLYNSHDIEKLYTTKWPEVMVVDLKLT